MLADGNKESTRGSAFASIDPATRLRIEQAVRELFAGAEFHRVKLIDVARHAHISLQTLYKYYGSKEVLLFASIDTWLRELARRVDDVDTRPTEDFRERLCRKFRVAFAYFERNPEIAQVIMTSACPVSWQAHEGICRTDLTSVFLAAACDGRAEGALTKHIDEYEISDFLIMYKDQQPALRA